MPSCLCCHVYSDYFYIIISVHFVNVCLFKINKREGMYVHSHDFFHDFKISAKFKSEYGWLNLFTKPSMYVYAWNLTWKNTIVT